MSETLSQLVESVDAELYAGVRHFYAHQMQLLDDGDIDAWVESFTEDGTYQAHAHPVPSRGRVEIAVRMRRTRERLVRDGGVRRHFMGMNAIRREGANLRVRSYALVIDAVAGAAPFIRASTTCEDILIPHGGSWLVRERRVSGDTPASLSRGAPEATAAP